MFTANDSEFISEETMVAVTSSINHPQLKFISGIYGPLEAGLPCQLPLWLAITLRKKGKCTISIPEWMSVESLERCIENEKVGNSLEVLPFYYIEIANLLFNHARDDIPSPDRVSVLVRDLENIRLDRMKLAIQSMTETVRGGEKVYVAKVTNISSLEIFAIHDFVSASLTQFRMLTTTKDENYRPPSNNNSNVSNTFDPILNNYESSGMNSNNTHIPEDSNRKLRRFRS